MRIYRTKIIKRIENIFMNPDLVFNTQRLTNKNQTNLAILSLISLSKYFYK